MATHPHSTDLNPQEHAHPTESVYVRVAIVLALITVLEVAIYYVGALRSVLVPALLVMSVAKFVTVVGYFMHLKFDDRRLTYIFGAAMVVTISVVLALDVMQATHAIDYAIDFLTGAAEPGTGEGGDH
jgi:cytochrome c oxidase subunit 4